MRPKEYIIIAIIVFSVFSACNKQEDFHLNYDIGIINYTDLNIDSLKIYSNTSDAYIPNIKNLLITDIESRDTTKIYDCQDLEINFLFKAFIEGDSVMARWSCPDKTIDPAGNVRAPTGLYIFGIIDCDTIKDEITIGLINYYFSCC